MSRPLYGADLLLMELVMNQKFFDPLIRRAKASPKSIVFPESTNPKMLSAAQRVADLIAVLPILIGKKEDIEPVASENNIDLSKFRIIDNTEDIVLASLAERYLQAGTDLTEKTVNRKLKNPLNFAAAMVRLGDADCLAAGADYSTGEVLLASQVFIGMLEGVETISSVGIVDAPGFEGPEGNYLIIGDCAVCQNPSSSELADIAISSADTASRLLGWEPRVALISYSSDGSGEGEMIEKVVDAVKAAQSRRPDLLIDGEFQLDTAIDPAVAAKKVKRESGVAGRANVIIFPDLNAGNIGVKLIQRFGKALAYGPIMQGFAKPVTDFSRGAPVDEIVGNLIMLAARA